jgi:hypothetical protein
MEEASEDGKETPNSAHGNGMNNTGTKQGSIICLKGILPTDSAGRRLKQRSTLFAAVRLWLVSALTHRWRATHIWVVPHS